MLAVLLLAVAGGCASGAPLILTIGDSKTVMHKVSTSAYNVDDWQLIFQRDRRCNVSFNIGTLDGQGWLGTNGITVGQRQDRIDADLAVMASGLAPTYILINLGTNDLTAMLQTEADWKADLLYILDALHLKWPAAIVYLPHVWKQGYNTQADTLAGWKNAVIASRSTFVKVGHDERIWAKGTDDGATMYQDGIHYSRLGAREHVAQWRTILGL